MTRLELAPWRGRLGNRGVISTIRRKIAGRLQGGRCVLVDLEDVTMTAGELAALVDGWPPAYVQFCGCREVLRFPLPVGVASTSCLK